ncbi:MAG TPA: glycerophosphodiester phosphodiesterase [Polyangiaceae bacterium]|nr:glycerophosphodiester phosphodiesterase [Polyangiaceae bacterium]
MKDEASFRRPSGAPPLVFGHRGVRGEAPENTMAAFETAAVSGADGVELDVRLCRSGELVVCHDADLSRLTHGGDTRRVADLDRAELARVDVGDGQPIPLLGEVLSWAESRGLRVNVEMKRDVPDRRAVVREIARLFEHGPLPPVLVSSFDPWMLAYLSWRSPSVLLGYLFASDQTLTRSGWPAKALHVTAVHPERTEIDAKRCRVWQKRGRLVNVWTVNDAAEARALAAMGVDAIITDVPRRIGDVVRQC